MAIGFKSTHQNCYSYYGGWNARFKLPNKNHPDNAFPFPLQFQLHLKLDNFHAAYAAIIVAIKCIICSLSKPATAATNKANGGCWFQWIVSNSEYNTFKPVVHFYFSDVHYAIWLRYNFISTFCSEKNPLLLLIQPDIHLGHLLISDIRWCYIVFFSLWWSSNSSNNWPNSPRQIMKIAIIRSRIKMAR